MARGRFISKSISTDIAVNRMSLEANLLYVMAIPHLDRDGMIHGDAFILLGSICPRRPQLLSKVDGCVQEWIAAGLVQAFDSQRDGMVLRFRGFTKHQVGMRYDREPPSEFEYLRDSAGSYPANIRQTSGKHPPEVEVKVEVKDEVEVEVEVQVEGQEQAQPAASPPSSLSNLDRRKMIERLQSEWPVGVGGTQIEAHSELVELYGIDAWRRGFDATKASARANSNYVAKVIASEIEKANEVRRGPKSKVEATMDAFDNVERMLEAEGIESWQ